MSKTLKTRVVNKHDTEANWLLATNFTPMNGEIIIYDEDDNYDYKRIKIGNGTDNVNDLDFVVNKNIIDTNLDGKADKEHTHNAEDIIGLDIGGGTAVQTNWEQTDPTASDYIKNKPFFDNGTEKEVIYDADITLLDAGDIENGSNINNMYGLSNNFLFSWPSNLPSFIEGQTYEIEFDNKTYNLLCQKGPLGKDSFNNITERLFLGNYFEFSNRTIETFDYTNAPFLITSDGSNTLWAFGEELRKKVNDQMVFHLTISTSPISMIRDKYLKKEFLAGRAGLGKNSEVFNNLEIYSAFGESSHAEGSSDPIALSITTDTTIDHLPARSADFAMAAGKASHVEGHNSFARGDYSHAEGLETTAYANGSHAEGINTNATGYASHAEGTHTEATGEGSHAGGSGSHATGWTSFAHGFNTVASGEHSTALGSGTTAAGQMQLAIGCCNEVDETSLLVAGWGESTNKKTVYKLSRSGAAWHKDDIRTEEDIWAEGNIYAQGTKQVATLEDIENTAEEALTTINQGLDSKVDKIDGKGLSTNDFTNELKTQLENLVAVGESAQSDFEINDESNPSFIKNRPVYHIPTEVWYPATNISVNNNNPGFSCGVSLSEEVIQKILEAGKCDVLYNGVKYYTTVKNGSVLDLSNATYIGNAQVYAQLSGETLPDSYDTGEPFVALILDDGLLFADATSLATTVTIGINKAEIIKKLDEKYLPDNAATKDYVKEAISSINKEEKTEKQIIFPESSLTFQEDATLGGLYSKGVYDPSLIFPLVEGNTYFVNWDGIEYECVAISGNLAGMNGIAIGNTGAVGIGEVSNEPFIIGYGSDNNINALISLDTQSTHTVSVSEMIVIPSSIEVEWDNVKNKPFGEKIGENKVIYENEPLTFAWLENNNNHDEAILGDIHYDNPILNLDSKYKFIIDGVEYELDPASLMGITVLGNLGVMGLGPDNGCPITLMEAPGTLVGSNYPENSYITMAGLADSTADSRQEDVTYNITLIETPAEYTLLDPKWIPDMYGIDKNILISTTISDMWDAESLSWTGECISFADASVLTLGEKYTVTVNNDSFEDLECVHADSIPGMIDAPAYLLGNLSLVNLGEDNQMPYLLAFDYTGAMIGAPIMALKHTLEPTDVNVDEEVVFNISIGKPSVIQIKEKYIPILEENNSGSYTIKSEYMPKEIANTSIILEEITPTFALDNSLGTFATSSAVDPTIPTFSLNDGEKYFVEWDNQVYPVISLAGTFMEMNGIAVGNTAALGIEGGSADAPFIIGCTETGVCVFVALDTNTSHSVKIWQKSEQIFDSFILNSSTPGSTKKFRITIDDDGNLSASEI